MKKAMKVIAYSTIGLILYCIGMTKVCEWWNEKIGRETAEAFSNYVKMYGKIGK